MEKYMDESNSRMKWRKVYGIKRKVTYDHLQKISHHMVKVPRLFKCVIFIGISL